MLFYRSSGTEPRRGLSLGMVRMATLAALVAYPAGCLLLILGPDGPVAMRMAGLALIAAALLAAAPVIGSRFQRIVADSADKLDEFELAVRHRVLSLGYQAFTALVLVAIIYLAVAADQGWWLPRSYEQFSALFWGVFLYACLLPTALLVWSPDGALADDATGGDLP